MKKLAIVVIVLAVLGAVVFLIVSLLGKPVVQSADEFFVAARDGDWERTRSYLSQEFRTTTSAEELADIMERSTLSRYVGASWTSRSISTGTAELQGTISTADGGEVPLTLLFVKEEAGWRIQSIQKQEVGIVDAESGAPLPDPDQLVALTSVALHDLGASINARDFTGFHEKIATIGRAQITPEERAAPSRIRTST